MGFGLETALGFCNTQLETTRQQSGIEIRTFAEDDGPPGRSSFPRVIGRTTPALRFAAGREVLLGDSPVGACTV